MSSFVWEQATRKNSYGRSQDALLSVKIDDESALFLLADGMGGRVAGAQAAEMSVRIVATYFLENLAKLAGSASSVSQILRTAIEMANREIVNIELEGAACLTVVYAKASKINIAHVGVNRLYHITKGRISRLTEIHDSLHALLKQGIIKPEDINKRPVDNKPTRFVGYSGKMGIDCFTTLISSGDYLVLCSQGALASWDDSVNQPEIRRIVLSGITLKDTCEQLVQFGIGELIHYGDASVIIIRLID